jgi:ABC-2 type transport system permease protein
MKTYFKVLILFWQTAILAELEYRLNFAIAALTSTLNLIGSVFGLFLFYQNNYQFQGWNWEEALIVLGIFTFLQGICATFLAPNLSRIVRQVQLGTLDFVLLKPISSQFWLSFRTLSLWGITDLLFGIALILYAGIKLKISALDYLITLFPISFGIIILYSMWFMMGTTSIWFVKIYNVTEVLRGLLEAGRYPMVAYPAIYRLFFTFIIPVAFLTTIPAETLLGRSAFTTILISGILAFSLLIFSTYFWKFALRFYTSASS